MGKGLLGGVLGIFSTAVFAVVGAVATVFGAIYLAANPHPIVEWVVRLFPVRHRRRAREVLSKSRESLLSWFKGQLVSMTIIGVLSGIALYIIGIPGAVILGIVSGLLEFVPYVGPIVSAIPPVLLGLAVDPIDALYVVIAYVLIQQAESHLITPLVMREVASVHPAVVVSMVSLLGVAFGLLGSFLAIPITVVAGVLVDELWFRRLEGGAKASEGES